MGSVGITWGIRGGRISRRDRPAYLGQELLMGRTHGVWQDDTECGSGEDSDEYEPQASTSVQGLSTRSTMRRTRGNSESNLTSRMRT